VGISGIVVWAGGDGDGGGGGTACGGGGGGGGGGGVTSGNDGCCDAACGPRGIRRFPRPSEGSRRARLMAAEKVPSAC
jgi:hypothetical protein